MGDRPIDGTRSFIIGQMHWATLIALNDGDRVVAGVAHQPYVGETFFAEANRHSPNGVGAASDAICGRDAAARFDDAVLACTDPTMFRTAKDRAALRRVAERVKLRAGAATATRIACSPWA